MAAIESTARSLLNAMSHAASEHGITARRRLTLWILAGALLTAPLPAYVAQATSCQSTLSSSSRVAYVYRATPLNQGQTGVRGLVALRLTLTIARNGAAQANGSIHIPDDPEPALGPYIPMLAICKNVITATVADLDGDGRKGLARVEVDALVAATGERVRVVLTPIEHDVDANGVYTVALQIDDTAATAEVRFRVDGDRSPHKGRRSR